MAGGNVSPRQKMINMMYLVLTALLALNVSKDILKAFHLVEISMEKAGTNIDQKNEELMSMFAKQAANQKEKVGPFYEKAEKAKKIKDEFVTYITALKKKVAEGAGGRKPTPHDPLGELVMMDNIEMHANMFINEGEGKKLKTKINETRENLLALLGKEERQALEKVTDLRAEDPKGGNHEQTWESEAFEHTPAAGVVTILTTIENNCKNTYTEVLNMLAKAITKDDRTFDKVEAKIIPKSTFVMSGGKFEADVMLVAYDSKQDNDVIIDGNTYKPENGIAHYEVGVSGQGERKVTGNVMMKTKDGNVAVPFDVTYTVYTGAATVAAEAMNMLYIGLDNPISISVPGFPPDRITATINGGGASLAKKSGSSYSARVTQRGDATITVTVKDDKGQSKSMGSMKFRVRNIPKPEAKLGGLSSGDQQPASVIKANATRVVASLGADFAFEGVKYSVTKFTILVSPKKGEAAPPVSVSGSAMSPQAAALLNKLKDGDKVILDYIEASGPDGVRKLPPIVITAR